MYDFIHIIQFLIHIFFCLWLFFTTVPLLMKIWTVLIICLHSSTAYHERNKSYIMQLFKIEKQNFFLFGSRKIWKSFPHIGKVFVKLGQNFGQNFTIFSKNQKQCQLPGVGLISKYRSLYGLSWIKSLILSIFNLYMRFLNKIYGHWQVSRVGVQNISTISLVNFRHKIYLVLLFFLENFTTDTFIFIN